MEDLSSTPMEVVSTTETVENTNTPSTSLVQNNCADDDVKQSKKDENLDASKEPFKQNSGDVKISNGDHTARQKFRRKNYRTQASLNKKRTAPVPAVVKPTTQNLNKSTSTIISVSMTEEEMKMLDYYKVKFSILKHENLHLHSRIDSLAKESIRLLHLTKKTIV